MGYPSPSVDLSSRSFSRSDNNDLTSRWIQALFGVPIRRSGCVAIGNAPCSYILGAGALSPKLIRK